MEKLYQGNLRTWVLATSSKGVFPRGAPGATERGKTSERASKDATKKNLLTREKDGYGKGVHRERPIR